METDALRREGAPAPAVAEILDGLNDLLQLDHDAIGAYDVAIEKLEDRDHASQIAGFRLDHERHIRELNRHIAELGGTPKNEPHATGPFKLALQSLGGLAGDKGLLLAWRTNELQVRTKYDRYAAEANHWPRELKRTIDEAALDEERHYAWVAGVLERMGVGTGEGAETQLADTLRERAAAAAAGGHTLKDRAAHAAETVRDRAADVAGTVRERVQEGVGSVSNRISGMLDRDEGPLAGVAETAGRVRTDVGDRAGDVLAMVEERVRTQPLRTLLIAGVAGFVLGRLLR